MESNLKNYGLIPKALPKRHPTTHQVFGSIAVADLPATLDLPDIVGPTDQGATSFCTCYAARQLCSDQDGIVYDENWGVAMTSEIVGAPIVGGAPALDAMNAMIQKGPLALSDCPPGMTWQEKGPAFIADWRNWPQDLALKAAPHEKATVLSVDGPYDAFDNIRAFMAAHKRHTALATKWYYQFNTPHADGTIDPVPDYATPVFTWHMYEAMYPDVVNGVEVIWVKPHEGAGYGKGGYAAFDRATINRLVAEPMACSLAFGDVPTSIVQRLAVQHLSLEQIFEEIASRIESAL
ncbi:MAG: hypothetical protein KGI03_00965 [Patescibacteria group bacterium]|nr:hypothetical protein [Patescibacteria group bacterium]